MNKKGFSNRPTIEKLTISKDSAQNDDTINGLCRLGRRLSVRIGTYGCVLKKFKTASGRAATERLRASRLCEETQAGFAPPQNFVDIVCMRAVYIRVLFFIMFNTKFVKRTP